jgi:hypothetical protein
MFYCQVSNIPGFNQVFGYRYSKQPNADGIYESVPIKSIAKRFFFLGFYISLEAKPEF